MKPNVRLMELSRFDGVEMHLKELPDVIEYLDIRYHRMDTDERGVTTYCEEELFNRLKVRG